uniref:Uncharacterized protein n=1 Tax=Anopheles farauti TaxID=69004 RepID=A0A182QZ68_9DIPT
MEAKTSVTSFREITRFGNQHFSVRSSVRPSEGPYRPPVHAIGIHLGWGLADDGQERVCHLAHRFESSVYANKLQWVETAPMPVGFKVENKKIITPAGSASFHSAADALEELERHLHTRIRLGGSVLFVFTLLGVPPANNPTLTILAGLVLELPFVPVTLVTLGAAVVTLVTIPSDVALLRFAVDIAVVTDSVLLLPLSTAAVDNEAEGDLLPSFAGVLLTCEELPDEEVVSVTVAAAAFNTAATFSIVFFAESPVLALATLLLLLLLLLLVGSPLIDFGSMLFFTAVELVEEIPAIGDTCGRAAAPLLSDAPGLTAVSGALPFVRLLAVTTPPPLLCCADEEAYVDICPSIPAEWAELETEDVGTLDGVPRKASADGLGMLRMEAFGCRTVILRCRLISVSLGSGASVFCTVWVGPCAAIVDTLVDVGKLIISGGRFTGA